MCRRNLTVDNQQIMTALQIQRVNPVWHPFKRLSCDYLRPFLVKNGRKAEKRYGCIFIFWQMRAVYLRTAYSLFAGSIVSALLRLIARSNALTQIISDNGTSFVEAEQEFRRAIIELHNARITHELLI